MTPNAPTVIICPTADPYYGWMAYGVTREMAEAFYKKAITSDQYHPPLYRIVVQNKADQHSAWFPSAAKH